ncbi:mitogen-activated protein kinase kinase kinase YODA-like isoform X2 [Vitis riparia]|uniref:mitogen-activated protein kinase kinase kinase YODA-like isoform X2 n=1 Tax=Vitis riparia TaxID=96939 RepID=UPI00155A854E|nr:mitogen-activated protein kinase kinase kinase YODA-like isoform X2 [Vitis riparia]
MALQESLAKFKKQQEKCQSTLTSIAAKAGSSKPTVPQKFTPAAPTKPPTPAVKFSNDTERLQHINSIRKAPVGAQIKRVIDLLLETRQAFTPEQINEACYVDTNANKAVFDSLRNNPKVSYDGKRFAYKSKHDLKDRSQLLVLVRKFPEGIAVIDLKDAYPSVMEDLQITGQSCLLSFKGSPYWMAPEVIKNSNGCNLAVDLWSLGCTVLEMATTKPPWSQYEGVAAMFKIGNSKELPTIPDHLSEEGKDFVNPLHRPTAARLLEHPFVRNAVPLERPSLSSEPEPPPAVTNAVRSMGIGHTRNVLESEGVAIHQSRGSKTGSGSRSFSLSLSLLPFPLPPSHNTCLHEN